MADQEQQSRKRWKRNQLAGLVLQTVERAGLMGMALIAPNVIGAIGKMGLLPHQRDAEMIRRTVDRLYARGLLKHAGGKLALTRSGEEMLRSLDTKFRAWKRPKRWDKRWRVLVFDIPEAKKNMRDRVRFTLQSIGFVQLQRSVWIFPYDCEEWVTLWKAEFKLGSELLYMIVDSIEGDDRLKRLFNID